MAVMEREGWTDERLDKAFDRVDADLRELRVDMKKGFERTDGKVEALDEKFDRKFDSLQRNMMTWFVAVFSAIITLAAAVIAAAALG
ncbi:MAG TPA: hypothetical protein VFR75_08475 [Solirubrobacterales bacterium]|nr:hypothetical protein [Solirubrobacterales bacterium]